MAAAPCRCLHPTARSWPPTSSRPACGPGCQNSAPAPPGEWPARGPTRGTSVWNAVAASSSARSTAATPGETRRMEAFVDEKLAPLILDRCRPMHPADWATRRRAHHHSHDGCGGCTRSFEGLPTIVAPNWPPTRGCCGFLSGSPMAAIAFGLAQPYAATDIDLNLSYGRRQPRRPPMLNTFGNPVAVSPDIGLMRAAGSPGWSIVEWPEIPSPRAGRCRERKGSLMLAPVSLEVDDKTPPRRPSG